jgi:MFS family permease
MNLGKVSDRLGHHRVMVFSIFGFACFPLLIGLVPTTASYMLASLLGGVGWGFLGGSLANRLMERAPDDDRPAHMALFNLTLNLGVLTGSLLGPVLGDWTGLQAAMVIGGVFRILIALVVWRWG